MYSPEELEGTCRDPQLHMKEAANLSLLCSFWSKDLDPGLPSPDLEHLLGPFFFFLAQLFLQLGYIHWGLEFTKHSPYFQIGSAQRKAPQWATGRLSS